MKKKAEEQNFGIFDHVPLGVFVLRSDFTVLSWNRRLEEWTGIKRSEILGSNICDRYQHLKEKKYTGRLRGIFDGGPPAIFSSQLHSHIIPSPLPDGTMRVQHTIVSPIPSADSLTIYALFAIQDVTDIATLLQNYGAMRDRAVEELEFRKNTEDKIRSIVTAAGEGIIAAGADSRISFVNQELCNIFGYTEKALLGRDVEMLMPEEYRGKHRNGLERYMKSGKAKVLGKRVELEGLKKDGSVFPLEIRIEETEEKKRKKRIFTAAIRDITERKEAEDKLKESYQIEHLVDSLLQTSLEELPLTELLERAINIIISAPFMPLESTGGIFLADEKNNNLQLAAHQGLPIQLQTLCANVPFGRCLCGRAAAEGKIIFSSSADNHHDISYDGMEPHGHYCVPIKSKGRLLGVMVLYVEEGHQRDNREIEFLDTVSSTLAGIIERKRAEESIKHYTKELEESNRLKDLFSDIIRHDLLNPIGAIRNSAEILYEGEKDSKKREIVDLILDTSTQLIETIDNASKYSQLEYTKRLECSMMDIGDIARECIKGFDHELEDKTMKIDFKGGEAHKIFVNPLIKAAIANIISNAIKYGPEGSAIEVGIVYRKEKCTLYVKDRGEGIPEDDKEKIFQRFERAGKIEIKGAGLGLAIVKRIVSLHDGKVWVEDNPEGGSVFYVSLPKTSA